MNLKSLAAMLLHVPFDVIFYFFPKVRERLAPEPTELLNGKAEPHPSVVNACGTLCMALCHSGAPNFYTFHMQDPSNRDMVITVHYADGMTPAEKICRLEKLLDEHGIDNPWSSTPQGLV